MKLYTRTGDDGTTGLVGGDRTAKDSQRVTAIGEVDEVNACCGLAATACDEAAAQLAEKAGNPGAVEAIAAVLTVARERLFELGADLATPMPIDGEADPAMMPRVGKAHIAEVEGQIDAACLGVPEMKTFVLPGGTELAARLHLARAVCRRAERSCLALSREEPINPKVTVYLNRLNDLLFALARQANHAMGVPDVPWLGAKG